jgi:adenylate cyclase class 2
MSASGQETEAKFYVHDLKGIESRLEKLGAQLIQERVLEKNIRFDLPGAPLRAEGRVLRLRLDTDVRLTYKSASNNQHGVLIREEIEFVVEDFEKAKRFLEALGYQKLVYYEKYRATYELQASPGFLHIMLDELPYGNFVEIEGETVESIRAGANQLKLQWERAVATSYSALFERARRNLNLSLQDLSFAEFSDLNVDAADLGVMAADL